MTNGDGYQNSGLNSQSVVWTYPDPAQSVRIAELEKTNAELDARVTAQARELDDARHHAAAHQEQIDGYERKLRALREGIEILSDRMRRLF